jgi:catechol 2,3-dioxygenase-like lactoylglutathione lyase family enzyme
MGELGARYGHTNVIARDWRRLASFYESIFDCVPVPPERDYSGDLAERGTGVSDAAFQGVHLRLPGHGADGPTLEICTYSGTIDPAAPPAANRVGWGHIAFMVDDVDSARTAVLAAGGQSVRGTEVVTTRTADGRRVTWCYLADPEGNLIELQSWSPADADD